MKNRPFVENSLKIIMRFHSIHSPKIQRNIETCKLPEASKKFAPIWPGSARTADVVARLPAPTAMKSRAARATIVVTTSQQKRSCEAGSVRFAKEELFMRHDATKELKFDAIEKWSHRSLKSLVPSASISVPASL